MGRRRKLKRDVDHCQKAEVRILKGSVICTGTRSAGLLFCQGVENTLVYSEITLDNLLSRCYFLLIEFCLSFVHKYQKSGKCFVQHDSVAYFLNCAE